MLENQGIRFRTFILENEDTDLNANNTPNPELSTTLFCLEAVFLSASFYLHYCLYRSTTRKDFRNKIFIIGKLLTCYSVIAPIIICYGFIYGNVFLTYNYPNSETLGSWFCYANNQMVFLHGWRTNLVRFVDFRFILADLPYRTGPGKLQVPASLGP